MITCPWCGTSYTTFQSNCDNCGGPLPAPQEPAPTESAQQDLLPAPPPAPPRDFSSLYIWRKILSGGWGIVGGVFTMIGGIFTTVGLALSIAIVTLFMGVIFGGLGLLFLGIGLLTVGGSYYVAQQKWQILRMGEYTTGQITEIYQNYNVSINGRNPWVIRYQFEAHGRRYEGQASSLSTPAPYMRQAGNPVYVLYLEQTPQKNTIYPPML